MRYLVIVFFLLTIVSVIDLFLNKKKVGKYSRSRSYFLGMCVLFTILAKHQGESGYLQEIPVYIVGLGILILILLHRKD